ncbi:MAG: hypothetical protein Q7S39_05160, partial [Ignavibacteria bacterium]|nr:hypothetical protein [Ignavibacteria bacterium]
KTTVVDYIRLAFDFTQHNIDSFYDENLDELINIDDYIEGETEFARVEKIFHIFKKHGEQIEKAIECIRNRHDKPTQKRLKNSFLSIIADQEYFKMPKQRLVDQICSKLSKAIPIACQNNRYPQDELAFNNLVSAFIDEEKEDYTREFPTIRFALAKTVPDHALNEYQLLIESKYLRGKTTMSVITDGIGADLIKYPVESHKLFIVYDPERKINDDETFKRDFESRGNCTIYIIR